jgi:hypothetical protein
VNINEEIKDGFPQPSKRRVSFNRHIGVKEYHPTDATGEVTFSDQVHFPVPDVPKTVKNQEGELLEVTTIDTGYLCYHVYIHVTFFISKEHSTLLWNM